MGGASLVGAVGFWLALGAVATLGPACSESHALGPPLSSRTSRAGKTGGGAIADAPFSSHIGAAADAGRAVSRSAVAQHAQPSHRSVVARLIAETGAHPSLSWARDKAFIF
jgi:hypothetical protein